MHHPPKTALTIAGLMLLPVLQPEGSQAAAPAALGFQGRVSVDGIPFSGQGRFKFALLNGAGAVVWSNSPDARPADGEPDAPLTLDVTKGLYTVRLGEGMEPLPPALFEVQDGLHLRVWFDDGTHGFQALNPDQQLASSPFALRATSAERADSLRGSLPASQLSGTLGFAQLPPTVARLDSSPAFQGTVSAQAFRGAGVVAWVPAEGIVELGEPNRGYLATSDTAPLQLNLPRDAHVGDVIRVSGAGRGGWVVDGPVVADRLASAPGDHWVQRAGAANWNSIAVSADGTRVLAAERHGHLWISDDSGLTWTSTGPAEEWSKVASSPDGRVLAAISENESVLEPSLWYSNDYGATWSQRGGAHRWSSVALMEDGFAASTAHDATGVWLSTDGFQTSVNRQRSFGFGLVTGATDGSHLTALAWIPYVAVSTDSGRNWPLVTALPWSGFQDWRGIASSASGLRVYAYSGFPHLWRSTDGGVHWASTGPSLRWSGVASSADGGRVAAAEVSGYIWLSKDGGDTWERKGTSQTWTSIAMSADGTRLFATTSASGAGHVYTSGVGVSGAQGEMAEFLYVGNGLWRAFPVGMVPDQIAGSHTFEGPVTVGGYHPETAPLGIRRDTANPSFGYCLSLHDRDDTPWWKIGADNSGVFSVGAAGLRDYDLAIDRTTGNVGIGNLPYGNQKLRVAGDLSVNGTGYAAGGFLQSSDARLKTHVTGLDEALTRVKALRGVTYEWLPDATHHATLPAGRQLGFVAQELATVLPELVHTNADGFLSVNYSGITPVLVEAVKQLDEHFEGRLAESAAEVDSLRRRLAQKEREFDTLQLRLTSIEAAMNQLSGPQPKPAGPSSEPYPRARPQP